ncbi:unnamed protein product [Urochloa decumbens]|uniref:ZF-HD dimerization-type domain-containing protein n=1 Tax=Urochloa decumbens TaxID=240449 RepID=A0ABC8YLK7_9POAL
MEQQHQERPREVYRECMRNHAAKLGTYASDGCCEYTPDDGQPAAMLCAACGCHRNFHRKAFLDAAASPGGGGAHGAMLASPGGAPAGYAGMHMALAAAMGGDAGGAHGSPGSRRRTRTKFTEEQKERMARFAERLGWRMPKREPGRAPGDDEVGRFCREIGVTRQVFKVWMHNHKAGGGGSGGAGGAGGAAQTSSSTTHGGGGGVLGGGGGSMSPVMGGDGEDDEEVRGSEMCM